MTRPTVILLALAAVFSTMVESKACKEGLDYCGFNLLRRGDYRSEIEAELKKAGLPVKEPYVVHSLFHCGGDGWIGWKSYCGVCMDGGTGNNDFC